MDEKVKLVSTFVAKPKRNCKIVINLHQGSSSANFYYEINTYNYREYFEIDEMIVRRFKDKFLVLQTSYLTEKSLDFICMVRNLDKRNYNDTTTVFRI